MSTATATLATTTLSTTVRRGDNRLILDSLTNVFAKRTSPCYLYIDRELIQVQTITGIGNEVIVCRGVEGTTATPHGSNAVVTIGRGEQFYDSDPAGLPVTSPRVSPHVNIRTGVQWAVQGDDEGPNADGRTWQPIVTTQTFGALGIRQNATVTPS